MPPLATFEVDYLQYLGPDSKPTNDLPAFAQDPETLLGLYRDMTYVRQLDARAIAMQRTGKMRTYPGSLGQEAVGTGAGSCLGADDVLVPYYIRVLPRRRRCSGSLLPGHRDHAATRGHRP